MKLHLYLLCALNVLFASNTFSQQSFENIRFKRIFKSNIPSISSHVLQTKDSGYLITGVIFTENIGNGDGLLTKVDKFGKKEWIRAFTQVDADFRFSNSIELADGSFVTVVSIADENGTLQKISSTGETIWQKKTNYFDNTVDFSGLVAYPDGSFAAIGALIQNTFESSSAVFKFDTDGNLQWVNHWNNNNLFNYPTGIIKKDDVLFISGRQPDYVSNGADTAYIVKLSASDGRILKSRNFWSGDVKMFGPFITKKADGTIILTSTAIDDTSGQPNGWVKQLDENLNILKSLKVTGEQGYYVGNVSGTTDNGAVLLLNNFSDRTFQFVKLDEKFNVAFGKKYLQDADGDLLSSAYGVQESSDRGFIIAANGRKDNVDFFGLIKTDREGNVASCATQTVPFNLQDNNVNSVVFQWNTVGDYSKITTKDFVLSSSIIDYEEKVICFDSSSEQSCSLKCTIKPIPQGQTFAGAKPGIMYLGYGPKELRFSSSVTSSVGNLTYSWSGNAPLSCSDCPQPIFKPTAAGTFRFDLKVRDQNGCTSTCTISVCVVDVRTSDQKSDKVLLCHIGPENKWKPVQLEISVNAVEAHLKNHPGDKLGVCGQDSCGNPILNFGKYEEPIDSTVLKLKLFPNPAQDHIYIDVEGASHYPITITIIGADGQTISTSQHKVQKSLIKLDAKFPPGFYVVQVESGNKRATEKFYKQ
jgi:hypothetical protein